MVYFIFFILLVLTGIGLFTGGMQMHYTPSRNSDDPRPVLKFFGVAAVVAGSLLFFLGGIRSVPVKAVGVVTSFGQVQGDLRPGFHWELPWKTANILDETIQTTTWAGKKGCLNIRIGGQQTACLYATIQWQIRDSAAPQLFNNYDTSGNVEGAITTAVVVREFEAVVNQVMGDYNPIADVSANSQSGNSQFSTFGPLVQAAMKRDIGSQILVRKVIIPFAQYDGSTQARLNTIQQQYAEAAIAKEQITVNDEQAQANAAIGAPTPQQLSTECYSIVQSAMKTNYKLPATFNCSGGTAGVVVSGG